MTKRLSLEELFKEIIELVLREFSEVVVDAQLRFTSSGAVERLRIRSIFKEMMNAYVKVEQILATLETLADEEVLKTIERSREEVAKGEYVECSISKYK